MLNVRQQKSRSPVVKRFVGVDISEKRGCAIAAIDESGVAVGADCCQSAPAAVVATIRGLAGNCDVVIGIDAPRQPLAMARSWYWNPKGAGWRPRKPSERGWGRHCEVVIASMGIANPQWTPLLSEAPEWMKLGFELFQACGELGEVHEVFPTASYTQLDRGSGPSLQLTFAGFSGHPKDVLDEIGRAHV